MPVEEEEPLPPHTGRKSQCKKCNAVAAMTEWRFEIPPGMAIIRGDDETDLETREHLRRRCHICGFAWNEDIHRPEPPAPPEPLSVRVMVDQYEKPPEEVLPGVWEQE